MQKVKLGESHLIDLTGKCKLGDIPEYALYQKLRDGRIMGLLVEDIIENHFANMTKVRNANAAFDLFLHYEDAYLLVQCKSSKTNRFCICPSHMKGKGRRFDLDIFLEYLTKFDVFVFAYIAEFPLITVTFMPVRWVADNMIVTRSDAYILL